MKLLLIFIYFKDLLIYFAGFLLGVLTEARFHWFDRVTSYFCDRD